MPPEPDLRGGALAIHAVGVGGSGMSGLARILAGMGHRVSGSDAQGGLLADLAGAGIRVHAGHAAAHLPPDAAVVIASAAVPASNPELAEARRRGIPVWKYAEAAGRLMRGARGVAIAGTHGKTTTTSAVAWVLASAGLDPSFLIGGVVPQLGGAAGFGRGPFFVVEACEYDRSFLNYRPEVALITNIDADHLDYYRDLDEIAAAFADFAAGSGHVVACGDDPRAARLATSTYGFSAGCAWRVTGLVASPAGSRYRLEGPSGALDLSTPLAGRHNALNTAGAAVACLRLGVGAREVAAGLASFRGAGRRLESLGEVRGIHLYDDYGHHPSEIACTLEALRQRHPGRPIRVIFQPHQFHRTRVFLGEFARVLAEGAEEVVVPGIYGARDASGPLPVASGDLVDAITAAGGRARLAEGLDDAARRVAETARTGDVVLSLGAGDIGALAPRLPALFR